MPDSPLKPDYDALEMLCLSCAHCTGKRYALLTRPGCGMMECRIGRKTPRPALSLTEHTCTRYLTRFTGVEVKPDVNA